MPHHYNSQPRDWHGRWTSGAAGGGAPPWYIKGEGRLPRVCSVSREFGSYRDYIGIGQDLLDGTITAEELRGMIGEVDDQRDYLDRAERQIDGMIAELRNQAQNRAELMGIVGGVGDILGVSRLVGTGVAALTGLASLPVALSALAVATILQGVGREVAEAEREAWAAVARPVVEGYYRDLRSTLIAQGDVGSVNERYIGAFQDDRSGYGIVMGLTGRLISNQQQRGLRNLRRSMTRALADWGTGEGTDVKKFRARIERLNSLYQAKCVR